MAGGAGFEPAQVGPKPTVLPIRPSPNRMVREEGLEPSRASAHLILSQMRLPIPPLPHAWHIYYTISNAKHQATFYYSLNSLTTSTNSFISFILKYLNASFRTLNNIITSLSKYP